MMPRWTGRIFVGVLLVAVTVAMLFPLWWMLVISLESPDRAAAVAEGGGTIAVWPESIHWSNYSEALKQVGSEPWQGFLDALANSIVITVLVVVGTVLSSSLVGFAFARIRFTITLAILMNTHALRDKCFCSFIIECGQLQP